MLDERIEQLINRRLDGALTEDESLELDRELIRSPETRRAFEDSQRIDALTSETLNALLDADDFRPGVQDGQVSPAARHITRRRLDGVIGVAAAVLLIMAGTSVWPQFGDGGDALTHHRGGGSGTHTAGVLDPGMGTPAAWPPEYSPVIDNTDVPRRQHERIDQDVIAVVDPQTRTVYLLEVERSRNRTNRLRADY